MEITREEAERALADIHQAMAQARRTIAYGGAPYYMMLWGVIWFLGYLGGQFLPGPQSGIAWLVLDLFGVVASIWIGYRLSTRVRTPMGPRLGLLWLAMLVYGVLIVWIANPTSSNQLDLLISLVAMLGYVMSGIWIGARLSWVGLLVTALAVLGYFLLPAFFSLWMAVLGGGLIFGSGLYIQRTWR